MKKPTTEGPRAATVDMSARAIGERLRRLEELFRLGLSLKKARRIGPSEPPQDTPPKVR